ncbi:hypothetical protein [Mycolicibacterium sp. HS_4_1]
MPSRNRDIDAIHEEQYESAYMGDAYAEQYGPVDPLLYQQYLRERPHFVKYFDDHRKYVFLLLLDALQNAGTRVSASASPDDIFQDCHHADDGSSDRIASFIAELTLAVNNLGGPHRWSDGRRTSDRLELARGYWVRHIWHPDPTDEPRLHWSGHLIPNDPGVPSPGTYWIEIDPAAQVIHATVVMTA